MFPGTKALLISAYVKYKEGRIFLFSAYMRFKFVLLTLIIASSYTVQFIYKQP